MSEFETRMGCQGDKLKMVIRWFDHNNCQYVTLVRMRVLEQDKPRTLVVEAGTTHDDDDPDIGVDDVTLGAFGIKEVYRVVGGEDLHATVPVNLKMNPAVKSLMDENARLQERLTDVGDALARYAQLVQRIIRDSVSVTGVAWRVVNSDDVEAFRDLFVHDGPSGVFCKECGCAVDSAQLAGTDCCIWWCANRRCGNSGGEWTSSDLRRPLWAVTKGPNSLKTMVTYLQPGQRFRYNDTYYIIPEQGPYFAKSVSIPQHQVCEGNAPSRYPMTLVGRDLADEKNPLRKGIRLEWMNPYTEVEVID